MATIEDQDRYFSGQQNASTPKQLLGEGAISRLINGRFIEGAISNAIGFDELNIEYVGDSQSYVPNGNVKYKDILGRGDIQLLAPFENTYGKFLVVVISGILFRVDLETMLAWDITPNDSFLPTSSDFAYPLSYLCNGTGVYGAGGYLTIFTYPNRPILINHEEARLSEESEWECPPAKFGALAANRAFVISGDNIMYASDPFAGANASLPLTFKETLSPSGAYTGDIYTIGSPLNLDPATALFAIPRLLGPAQDFLGHNLWASTSSVKFLIAVGSPRADWDNIQFIAYAGTSEGAAGSLGVTNVGSTVVYISSTGRIKTLYQDQERESSLTETYFDEDLGQYLNYCESSFYYRSWYRELDHSKSMIRYSRDRLYATVYPYKADALGKYNNKQYTMSHKALAIGSLASDTRIGPQASIAWEGFYDWLNPVCIAVLRNTLYVIAKNEQGRIQWFRENNSKVDEHPTMIFTRGYFAGAAGKSKSLMEIALYFRRLAGEVTVKIYYLSNNEWKFAAQCSSAKQLVRFNLRKNKCKTDSGSIPLRIEIQHNGCRFELERINVDGEVHREEKK